MCYQAKQALFVGLDARVVGRVGPDGQRVRVIVLLEIVIPLHKGLYTANEQPVGNGDSKTVHCHVTRY